MNEQTKLPDRVDPEKGTLNKRLETVAWGLFLILLGGFMFFPKGQLPDGLWSMAVGMLMLGLNITRYFNHIRMSGFTTLLGLIAVIGGFVQLYGVRGMEGAFLLIILGAYLIIKPWFDRQNLFGKAEES